VVSLMGSGLTTFALGVWGFQVIASTMQYAFITICSRLPAILVSPNRYADPVDRLRRVLLSAPAAVGR
jgi:MFS transporter, DHA3 family, macrolide efflux protein